MTALSVRAWLPQEFLLKTRQRRTAAGRKQRSFGKQTSLSGCKVSDWSGSTEVDSRSLVQAKEFWSADGQTAEGTEFKRLEPER